MLSGWSWIIYAVPIALSTYSCTDEQLKACGHITPESSVLAIGSQFIAFCTLNETCIDLFKQNASHIIWKSKATEIPEEKYTVINQTTSSVTLNVSSSFESPLTCSFRVYGQIEQTLHGIFFTLGLPPDKPEYLTCIVYNDDNLTCTWNPGRPTFLPTNFTLKHQWSTGKHPDCIPVGVNNSCTILEPHFQFFVDTWIWVEAENALGKARSDSLTVDPVNIVKPNPPVIEKVISRPELPYALKIVWENPLDKTVMDLKYNIRYKASSSMNWAKVPEEDTATYRNSFTLQDLKPYTEYVISLRCRNKNGSGYWSDWSKEKSTVTPETKPIKGPDLWRKIGDFSQGNRHVLLKWKKLEHSNANGVIKGYTVAILKKRPPVLTFDTTETNYTVNLTKDACTVMLTAHNKAGTSPASVLTIPAMGFKELPSVTNITTFVKDNQLWVEWTAPNESDVKRYVIEWHTNSNSTIEWLQESSRSRCTFLQGNIMPLKRYRISIYPLYRDGHGRGRSIEAYLKQGPPTEGPSVSTRKVGKNEAVLTWSQIPVNYQNGFIRNYTLFYKPNNGNESSVTIDESRTEYTLTPLSGNTQYMVRMKAYTDSGGTDGPDFTFTTLKFANGEIEAIVVPVCLVFLFTTLFGALACFYKRALIKKYIWPNVPDPSKSNIGQWSPQIPTRNFNSKNQPYPEGSFPDVSVVEITADDKKSFSEQDIKALDPLKKEKSTSEGHSSGIGGSSCMSSPRQSVSDSDESESAQTTSSTVQYSTVVLSGYRDQQPPAAQTFARSESTQPLLDSEERPEESPAPESLPGGDSAVQSNQYFKQNCSQAETIAGELDVEHPRQDLHPINEEDLVKLNQLQASDQSFQFSGVWPVENQLEVSERDIVHTNPEGHVGMKLESTVLNAAANEEPKCYLPQTVRQGGYMPQ
ncbi:interleukin-6 receptor subunit beta isoform X2 [Microcaecilia unicolor]|uniref:Interleukin-6 receptor subunit beta n=1 Tax=Microcaecilia unicolor TaxID=1415580 RepID=A0A6P7XEE3_9AMPH|nr:interleukin-6 receptor subunit beta isoform X2 [Microcaecilia unicolor]